MKRIKPEGSGRIHLPHDGEVYHELTLLHSIKTKSTKNIKYLARCSCGNTREVLLDQVKAGRTKMCKGCVKEARAKRYQSMTKVPAKKRVAIDSEQVLAMLRSPYPYDHINENYEGEGEVMEYLHEVLNEYRNGKKTTVQMVDSLQKNGGGAIIIG